MSRFVDGKVILKCKVCANQDCSRDDFPCKRCSDNEQYTSHYKPHKVYQELLDAGVTFAFPKTVRTIDTEIYRTAVSAASEYELYNTPAPAASEYPSELLYVTDLNEPCTMFISEDGDRK